ncbi:MAG TPA: SDR family NAD(P)-dependent oxidoreductase [Candidatus Methylomirabilis sp.]|nr:SDR family NAD(P)-dependent oxidoreductase [Candidatus Methylomirabilis sp.]
MRFEGKVALISGAGAGIGRATAAIIGREGGAVVAVDTDQAALDRLGAESGGGRVLGIRGDALDAASVADIVRRAVDAHGRIDVLVNAVGGSTVIARPAAALDELSLEEWQKLLHFNLTGTFLFCHAVVPVMKRQKSGKIVNISSIAGRGLSQASSSAYATAKGGIIALTRKLAMELGPHGITVNAIAPSLTLSERIRPHWERRTTEAQTAEITRTPLGRVAMPEDQARVICFLASRDADFVTGVTIDVTGGQ